MDASTVMQPFSSFSEAAVEKADSGGWVWVNLSRDRICDWFGPSDFGLVQEWQSRQEVASQQTAAEKFANWLAEGPKLADAAGCYVAIKVTEAKRPKHAPTDPLSEGGGNV